MATRDELIAVVAERYARSTRKDRGRILDEFGALTGLHRKHAMRLLRARALARGSGWLRSSHPLRCAPVAPATQGRGRKAGSLIKQKKSVLRYRGSGGRVPQCRP